MRRLRAVLRGWLQMACVWSLATGLLVLVEHQVLRLQADDPQLQLAEDAAQRLAGGADPKSVLPAERVAIERSQAPFVAVYDAAGAALASSGKLHGAAPKLPAGVFDLALSQGGHRLSWQPEPGLRQALVIVPVRSGRAGFALAGRSLREAEARKRQVSHLALLAWALGLGACFVTAFVVSERLS